MVQNIFKLVLTDEARNFIEGLPEAVSYKIYYNIKRVAGTGCQGDRPQNLIVAEKAKELRDKRIARMKEVHDEEFDKLVSGSDDRDMMDSAEPSVEESILQDAETTDNGSIDIQSEE